MGKMKRLKRIALRGEKTKRNFASFVALACGFIWIKSVHTAYYVPAQPMTYRSHHTIMSGESVP